MNPGIIHLSKYLSWQRHLDIVIHYQSCWKFDLQSEILHAKKSIPSIMKSKATSSTETPSKKKPSAVFVIVLAEKSAEGFSV